MKLFKIVFDNPNESFFAGQVVQGKILIYLNRPKKIKALKLRCIGRAEVNWTERSGKTSNSYHAAEPYFSFDRILLGEETQDLDIVLPAGQNAYPFYIQLPGGIPSSFQGGHGHVQYFVKATITRPWKFAQKVSSYFTVNGFLDLNLFGHASRPLTVVKRGTVGILKWLGCICCGTSVVEFQLSLEKTGFVPGDKIPFSIHVRNESSHRVTSINLTLFHIASFMDAARTHHKTERKVVNKLRGPSVGPRQRLVWDSASPQVSFNIPAVPPTNLGGGSIITLQYYLAVTLEMSTCFEAPIEGKVQIIIGTVPYRNLFEELMPTSCQALPLIVGIPSGTDSAPAPSHPVTVTPLDFNSPPPSYAEAMEFYNRFGSTLPSPSAPLAENPGENGYLFEEDEAGNGRPFNPRYAIYEWDRSNNRSS